MCVCVSFFLLVAANFSYFCNWATRTEIYTVAVSLNNKNAKIASKQWRKNCEIKNHQLKYWGQIVGDKMKCSYQRVRCQTGTFNILTRINSSEKFMKHTWMNQAPRRFHIFFIALKWILLTFFPVFFFFVAHFFDACKYLKAFNWNLHFRTHLKP